jgi:hypothetical protein
MIGASMSLTHLQRSILDICIHEQLTSFSWTNQ